MANLKSIWTEITDEETGETRHVQSLVPVTAEDLVVRVSKEDVNNQVRFRIQQLLGAKSHDEAIIKQLNLSAEYARLQNLSSDRTAAEIAEAAAIAKTHAEIKRLVAVSNELSRLPPADFSDDRHWVVEHDDG